MTENSPPQTYSGSDVFVSYASQDAAVADAIVRDLEAHGIKCWIAPRDVRPGTVYADAIVGAINESKALVLVLSANAMPSAHIGREVERAASKRKQLIAFRVDATPLSRELEYFLSNSQWIDVPKLGMPTALTTLTAAVRQAPATSSQPVSLGRTAGVSRRTVYIAAAAVGVGLAVAGAVYFWSKTQTSASNVAAARIGSLAKSAPRATTSDKSIAVLPLANESGDPNQQYFSDGLSENLITALAQFPGLKVIGRTSAFQFRDSKEDAHSIGAKLGVARLLEGSVQRSGETVRVRADLIDTTDGSTQWSERYDRPYKDLFALQDDITHAVVTALQTRLLPGQQVAEQSDRPPSGSLEAYNALLQGRFYGARDTESDVRRAIVEYRRATQLDPKYAFAWCALSWEWSYLAGQFLVPTQNQDELKNAHEAADRALALAPGLAAAHLARATVLISPPFFNWKGALAESRRALELAPSDPDAKFAVGAVLATLGEVEQAIELTHQSLAADPLHASRFGWLSTYLIALNRLDEAERAARTSIDLLPAGTGGGYRGNIVVIELLRGNAAAALATAQQEPSEDWRYIELALARQVGDDRAAADAALRTAIEKVGKWSPYNIADIYAVRGDSDKTFEWLDRAWGDRETTINGLLLDPFLLRFKNDPRFAAFCRKVGLPVPGEKGKSM